MDTSFFFTDEDDDEKKPKKERKKKKNKKKIKRTKSCFCVISPPKKCFFNLPAFGIVDDKKFFF
jgi:hypothetical protein